MFEVRVEGSWLGFIGVGIAFCLLNAAFGLMLATLGRSAPATRGFATMATLLLGMIGGAWVPAFVFPRWLQNASLCAHALGRRRPGRRHVGRLALQLGDAAHHRAGWQAAVCLAVAIWRFRWEE